MDFNTIIRDMTEHGGSSSELTPDLIKKIDNSETLHLIAMYYNWDDGIQIPQAITENKNCELSTALTIFYLAEGYSYLADKDENNYTDKQWYLFVKKLYNRIIRNNFKTGDIKFVPPLSKVQMYKLKRCLNENEMIFTESIGTKEF